MLAEGGGGWSRDFLAVEALAYEYPDASILRVYIYQCTDQRATRKLPPARFR